MKKSIFTLAALVCISAVAAHITTSITLTFTGLQNVEPINNFYNGGTGGFGSTGSTNYGIAFSSDSLAVISRDDGGTGNVAQYTWAWNRHRRFLLEQRRRHDERGRRF